MSAQSPGGRSKKAASKPTARKASGSAGLLAPTHGTAFFVYIAGADPNGTLTVGATGNLAGVTPLFVYWFERLDDIPAARALAARIETWPHTWKVQMIARTNPEWRDLAAPA